MVLNILTIRIYLCYYYKSYKKYSKRNIMEQEIKEITVPKTYTITLEQVGKLKEMELGTGVNKSELVRMAIDKLYEAFLENQI